MLMSYFYIFATVILTVYGQVVVKWRITQYGALPDDTFMKIKFLLRFCLDPFVLTVIVAAFMAALCWMAAISKIPLSVGFPLYYGLTFVLTILCSVLFLNESLTSLKMIGIALIMVGVIVGSMG